MKKLLIASALAAIAFSGSALADDRGKETRKAYEEMQREAAKDRREAIREYEKDRREHMREAAKDHREAEREYLKDRREADRERRADAREHRRWARGEYIPRDYLADRYYVRDYRDYDLAVPPDGHRWVRPYQSDDTYYLVQVATGLISRILGH
ncbi:RcnB family protein [Lysobacter sp. D1-1-M9]|uniref:RcnB family protein n=1 Tax=Novilysobacter longmucuonensis TaxID=3098603 RepID=UPI002FC6FFD2